jgi:protein-S-isoprenylcysteine O-methyltransferase Ste14
MSDTENIKQRSIRQLLVTLLLLAAFLLIPAGSSRFWQAWLFLGLTTALWTFFLINFLKHDRQLVERRLQRRETEPEHRRSQKVFPLIVFAALLVAGLDFRFGWSRALRPVPLGVVALGLVLAVTGYCLVFWVMKTNTFAASTIRVETGQNVIDRGPYALVRHPMYLGMVMTALGIPLALASYVALPVFALLLPLLVYRLIHEERTLRRNLPGYPEYCDRTRRRLVPWLW